MGQGLVSAARCERRPSESPSECAHAPLGEEASLEDGRGACRPSGGFGVVLARHRFRVTELTRRLRAVPRALGPCRRSVELHARRTSVGRIRPGAPRSARTRSSVAGAAGAEAITRSEPLYGALVVSVTRRIAPYSLSSTTTYPTRDLAHSGRSLGAPSLAREGTAGTSAARPSTSHSFVAQLLTGGSRLLRLIATYRLGGW
jgi:hypothetical protein